MDRIKFVGLVMLPLLIPLAPGAWVPLEKTKVVSAQRGTIGYQKINECSGLAISRSNKNALWLHNDSGDEPRLYLVGLDGKTQSTAEIKQARAIDWEDMCSFSHNSRNWLLVADTGDNQRNRAKRRPRAKLYLVEEPKKISRKMKLKPSRVIEFEYEDGPHDCEGIAVDTTSGTILLITKSLLPTRCHLYSLPLEPEGELSIARKIADIPVPIATAMDVSPDGRKLVIINPRLGFLIQRGADEDWSQASGKAPIAFELPSAPQIEAVCFHCDGQRMFIVSEGLNQPIWELTVSQPDAE